MISIYGMLEMKLTQDVVVEQEAKMVHHSTNFAKIYSIKKGGIYMNASFFLSNDHILTL